MLLLLVAGFCLSRELSKNLGRFLKADAVIVLKKYEHGLINVVML